MILTNIHRATYLVMVPHLNQRSNFKKCLIDKSYLSSIVINDRTLSLLACK